MTVVVLIALVIASQAIAAAKATLTTGTEFVVAFPCMAGSTDNINLFLFVTNANSNAATISIYSSNPNFDPMNQGADAQSTTQIQINDPDLQVCYTSGSSNVVSPKGFLIQSTQPVSVYVDMETSDGRQMTTFMVLPKNMLGTQYPLSYRAANAIIATEDNTQITFGISSGINPISLDRLQVCWLDQIFAGNMTSNHPVAVIYPMNGVAYDYDAMMALPSIYKGNEFPVIPHPNITNTFIRVFALEDHTYISVNGLSQHLINAGGYIDFSVQGPTIIATNKKSHVLTYYYYVEQGGNDMSRQQMSAYVVPPNYFITSNRVLFHPLAHIPSSSPQRDPVHTLAIITSLTMTGEIALDGAVIPALQYRRIPSSSYYYALIPVSTAQHVITTTAPNVKYTASVYNRNAQYGYASAKFNIALDLPLATEFKEE